ncbi:autotransporter assembly complex protein TamA [Methylorubrum suomiense]|uniref:Outer membrane protein assembly factor BamA n=1 Tax=Methylorubrum suomiense TaxID=144191 RepID=A0ABQ4UYT6_9HYPH|nr:MULTISPECIES: autotransporter assembly complex family protein [Methylobacteriaceae]GJE76994.1 Outer membrane protein assembly factor BamA [Methylorubrum suomiense]
MTVRKYGSLRSPVIGGVFLSAVMAAGLPQPAAAFDLFGLFGSEEEPPTPTPSALPYSVRITGTDDSDVLTALQDTSTLYRLRQEAPPDGEGLVRRAEADLRRLTDVLSGYGYYQGTVSIRIDGVPVTGDASLAAAARAAEGSRARALVPVKIAVDLGPAYTVRSVRALDPRGRPFPAELLPERFVRPGDDVPARSATVLAREARIVDRFRALGHPFAKAVSRDPVVDDAAHVMDVTFTIDPGPKAGLGEVAVSAPEGIDPSVIRSFIYTEPGDPYSPKAVADIRRSVARIEGLGAIRVREGESLDPQGNLPIFVEVSERERNLIGVSARYSTVDGPGIRAYYANRNLFGGAETLRLDADIYYLGLGYDPFAQQRKAAGIDTTGLGGRLSATFVKPALWGSRNDLLANAFVTREVQQSYFVDAAGASVAVRHRFSDTFSAQIGVDGQVGRSKDALGTVNYRLIGVPVSVTYDSTDNLLDPTQGFRFQASAAPYPGFLGSDPGIFVAKAQGSTYYALDEDANYILAGRLGFGSVSGARLDEIPDNFRFFAGGGGSVRGFAFRTLGPRGPFNLPIGGRSLLEASIEARIKVTDTIGIVPFFDAGTAFASTLPDFDERIRKAVGLGLRYYTGIGPIRVDVAFPLDRIKGYHERPVALYISLGQAF